MKCSECGGTGEVEIIGDSVTDVCDKCGGTGFFCEMRTGDFCALGSPCPHQKPMTNEEYIRSCSTEELTTLLCALVDTGILNAWTIMYHCADSDSDAVRIWLQKTYEGNKDDNS